MREDPKITKAYEIIANMSNQAVDMRKTIDILISVIPKPELVKLLAELYNRRIGRKK